jgi:hypothetical protein
LRRKWREQEEESRHHVITRRTVPRCPLPARPQFCPRCPSKRSAHPQRARNLFDVRCGPTIVVSWRSAPAVGGGGWSRRTHVHSMLLGQQLALGDRSPDRLLGKRRKTRKGEDAYTAFVECSVWTFSSSSSRYSPGMAHSRSAPPEPPVTKRVPSGEKVCVACVG